MPHRPGHRGSSTQARRVEQTRREQSIADRRRAAQSMQRAGISSLGGAPTDVRRQRSIDRGYVPPQEGGGTRGYYNNYNNYNNC